MDDVHMVPTQDGRWARYTLCGMERNDNIGYTSENGLSDVTCARCIRRFKNMRDASSHYKQIAAEAQDEDRQLVRFARCWALWRRARMDNQKVGIREIYLPPGQSHKP